jgi:hypothetical protein
MAGVISPTSDMAGVGDEGAQPGSKLRGWNLRAQSFPPLDMGIQPATLPG